MRGHDRWAEPGILGGIMVGFLALVVLITKGPVAALEMVLAGGVVVLAVVWYDTQRRG